MSALGGGEGAGDLQLQRAALQLEAHEMKLPMSAIRKKLE